MTTLSSYRYFNPRTHMGCDDRSRSWRGRPRLFQSTHPHGVRHTVDWFQSMLLVISIHAPTWGATCVFSYVFYTHDIFQSTHPHGVRLSAPLCFNKYTRNFNPRTHMGCDGIWISGKIDDNYFNPRTHMGCDEKNFIAYCRGEISIHAPTWGATMRQCIHCR